MPAAAIADGNATCAAYPTELALRSTRTGPAAAAWLHAVTAAAAAAAATAPAPLNMSWALAAVEVNLSAAIPADASADIGNTAPLPVACPPSAPFVCPDATCTPSAAACAAVVAYHLAQSAATAAGLVVGADVDVGLVSSANCGADRGRVVVWGMCVPRAARTDSMADAASCPRHAPVLCPGATTCATTGTACPASPRCTRTEAPIWCAASASCVASVAACLWDGRSLLIRTVLTATPANACPPATPYWVADTRTCAAALPLDASPAAVLPLLCDLTVLPSTDATAGCPPVWPAWPLVWASSTLPSATANVTPPLVTAPGSSAYCAVPCTSNDGDAQPVTVSLTPQAPAACLAHATVTVALTINGGSVAGTLVTVSKPTPSPHRLAHALTLAAAGGPVVATVEWRIPTWLASPGTYRLASAATPPPLAMTTHCIAVGVNGSVPACIDGVPLLWADGIVTANLSVSLWDAPLTLGVCGAAACAAFATPLGVTTPPGGDGGELSVGSLIGIIVGAVAFLLIGIVGAVARRRQRALAASKLGGEDAAWFDLGAAAGRRTPSSASPASGASLGRGGMPSKAGGSGGGGVRSKFALRPGASAVVMHANPLAGRHDTAVPLPMTAMADSGAPYPLVRNPVVVARQTAAATALADGLGSKGSVRQIAATGFPKMAGAPMPAAARPSSAAALHAASVSRMQTLGGDGAPLVVASRASRISGEASRVSREASRISRGASRGDSRGGSSSRASRDSHDSRDSPGSGGGGDGSGGGSSHGSRDGGGSSRGSGDGADGGTGSGVPAATRRIVGRRLVMTLPTDVSRSSRDSGGSGGSGRRRYNGLAPRHFVGPAGFMLPDSPHAGSDTTPRGSRGTTSPPYSRSGADELGGLEYGGGGEVVGFAAAGGAARRAVPQSDRDTVILGVRGSVTAARAAGFLRRAAAGVGIGGGRQAVKVADGATATTADGLSNRVVPVVGGQQGFAPTHVRHTRAVATLPTLLAGYRAMQRRRGTMTAAAAAGAGAGSSRAPSAPRSSRSMQVPALASPSSPDTATSSRPPLLSSFRLSRGPSDRAVGVATSAGSAPSVASPSPASHASSMFRLSRGPSERVVVVAGAPATSEAATSSPLSRAPSFRHSRAPSDRGVLVAGGPAAASATASALPSPRRAGSKYSAPAYPLYTSTPIAALSPM